MREQVWFSWNQAAVQKAKGDRLPLVQFYFIFPAEYVKHFSAHALQKREPPEIMLLKP